MLFDLSDTQASNFSRNTGLSVGVIRESSAYDLGNSLSHAQIEFISYLSIEGEVWYA